MRWAGLWLACLLITGTAHAFERLRERFDELLDRGLALCELGGTFGL